MFLSFQAGFAQISGLKVTEKLQGPVSPELISLQQNYGSQIQGGQIKQVETDLPFLRFVEDRVIIDAIASGDAKALLADLEALGLKNGSVYGHTVSGELPVSAIGQLSGLASLNFIRPSYAQTSAGLVTSQGDRAMRSDLVRTIHGIDGSGMTVGVLSDSYNSLGGAPADVASGDLPPGVSVLLDLPPGFGTDEGRAMMQLVHDVAPGASQAFHSAFFGMASFASGIIDLATIAGSDVIVDDVIYFAEPMFQDGIIAQATDIVNGMGVNYFSSAGNQARDAYQSTFRASGVFGLFGGMRHDFDPGPGVDDLIDFTLGSGVTYFSFQWDEPYFSVSGAPGSASDMDIVLYLPPGIPLFIGGFAINIGGDPIEVFGVINSGPPTTLQLGLELFAGPEPGLMKFSWFGSPSTAFGPDLYAGTFAGANYGHSNAAGAEAVGASAYFNTPEFGADPAIINGFSSAGTTPILFDLAGSRLATPIIRPKPGVTGPDGGNTTFFGFDYEPDGFPNFFGTSASAPHVAAVAALMKQADPTLTPAQVRDILRDTAADMDDPFTPGFDTGFDEGTGYGFVQADIALDRILKNRVFLANSTVKVDGNDHSEGDIHSNGNVWFGTGKSTPAVHAGDVSAVKDVTIHAKNTIDGDVTAGDDLFLFGSAAVTGAATEGPVAPVALPTPAFVAGGPDVTVPKKGTVMLPPGSYGKVKVMKKGTLKLESGTYNIDILDTDKKAALMVDVSTGRPAYINVATELEIDDAVEMHITAPPGKDGTELVIVSALQSKKIDVGKNALVLGSILATDAEVHFSRGSGFKGSICADKVTVEKRVVFLHHSSSGMPKRNLVPDAEKETLLTSVVTDFELQQNYPNPFNPSTNINFALPEAADVTLKIYNSLGQVVRTLVSSSYPAGRHTVTWNGTDEQGVKVASGVYMYTLKANNFTAQHKLVLTK